MTTMQAFKRTGTLSYAERQRVREKISDRMVDLMTYADQLGLNWEAIYQDARAIYRKESGQSWWQRIRCWWQRRS